MLSIPDAVPIIVEWSSAADNNFSTCRLSAISRIMGKLPDREFGLGGKEVRSDRSRGLLMF